MSLRRIKGTVRKLRYPVLSLRLILVAVRNEARRSVLRTCCYVMLCLQILEDVMFCDFDVKYILRVIFKITAIQQTV
jgi:hypothetical protein